VTIQQAIEKAKQLRKERAEVAQPVARAAAPAASAVLPQAIAEAAPARSNFVIDFPRIDPDLAVCARNRILIGTDRDDSTASAYDAYRIVRTQLRQRSTANGWRRFAVTSAGQGEGKSTTSLNLALALAREKRESVFLLDLDLRSPSVAEYLGLTPRAEIGLFLTGEGSPADVFFSIGVEQLTIAAGTQRFDNSSELLSGPRLEELLTFIAAQDPYAWIVADLPPLLATADALVIAPKVSATVVVVSEGKTRRDELQRAAEMLTGVGAEIAGMVLNRSTHASSSYYGY
jgi:protein-tyrosine kinase